MPNTSPYPLGPNSASGTAPRTIVTRPLAMPNSKVKASADAKLPPPSISKMNESGVSNIETRPTSIGCHWRASVSPDAADDLRDALERGDRHGDAGREPGSLQHRHQMHRHGAEHDRARRHDEAEQQHREQAR